MGRYRIFLASSAELEQDRRDFELLINRTNKEWYNEGTFLDLVIWEDFLDHMSMTRLQDEYNEAIKECDIFVMLFYTKVGMYTREEFELSYAYYLMNRKPIVYVYQKASPRIETSVTDFVQRLKSLGHFQTPYTNNVDLLHHFNKQLVKLKGEGFFDKADVPDNTTKELTLNVPKTNPKDIIGRDEDLKELHDLLNGRQRVVVVNGLGGIGKTTLAQAYVSKYYNEYNNIAWITQSSDDIRNDFINTAGLLDSLSISASEIEPTQLFNKTLVALKNLSGRNLLIIDNAEETLNQHQDIFPPHWHLLVTSREKIDNFYHKELDFLDDAQAITLFKKHYTRTVLDEQDIRDVVQNAGCHTLAIEILAKTAQMQRYDAAKLKQAIAKDLRGGIKIDHNRYSKTVEGIGTYLNTVFNLSKLNEHEIWLMKQFVCLPAEFHTYDLLRELVVDEKGPYANDFAETLAGLVNKGWLMQNAKTDAYKMHRIVAEIMRKEQLIKISDLKHFIRILTEKLSFDYAKDNPIDKFIWVPFGLALFEEISDGESDEVPDLGNNLALRVGDPGNYEEARSLLEKAAKSAEKNFGEDHPTTAIRYSNLAMVLQDLGDYQAARSLLEKVTESDIKNFGEDHPSTAKGYVNLAVVLQDLGDYEASRLLLQKAVTSNEKNFGEDHPSTAKSYSHLASLLRDLGDCQAARSLMEKAMRSAEKNFGEDHSITGQRYSNLAVVLHQLGDFNAAISLQEKAVANAEKNFGEDHPSTAINYGNLARLLQDIREYNTALKLSEKALIIFKKLLPEGHPDIQWATEVYQSIKNDLEKTTNQKPPTKND